MDTAQELDRLDLFKDLSSVQKAVLMRLSREMNLVEGTTLFKVGDQAQQIFILLDGKIVISVQPSSRPERIAVVVLNRPGELIGWSGMVRPRTYTASATCLEPTRLLALDGDDLMTALEQDPLLGFRFMQHVAEVISGRLRLIEQVTLKTL